MFFLLLWTGGEYLLLGRPFGNTNSATLNSIEPPATGFLLLPKPPTNQAPQHLGLGGPSQKLQPKKHAREIRFDIR